MNLLEHVESAAYRGVMALPQPLQQLVAGRPLRREGQTLATDQQTTLRMMRLAREPELGSVPVAESRALYRRQTALTGGQQPIGEVRDVRVGERAGRLYTPRGVTGTGPLLVWFHGGGFLYGDLDTHDPALRFLAERSGVRVLSVDYRLAPEHPFPAALEDCVAVLRARAEEGPFAVGGDSAGGGLAAAACLELRDEGLPIVAQLLVTPLLDTTLSQPSISLLGKGFGLTQEVLETFVALYLGGADPRDPRCSPLLADDLTGLPPAIVVTAECDPLRDEGEAYAARLRAAGVPVAARRWDRMIHGFAGMSSVTPAADEALDWMVDELGRLSAH